MKDHPLFQPAKFTEEFNAASLIGKVLAGAATAIAVRWLVEQYDQWIGRAK